MSRQKIIVTVGLPGSGKSTWARKQCALHPETLVRVCRDDIRNMMGTYWVPSRENLVTKVENASVDVSIQKGYSIIVDATNFKSINKWQQLAKEIKLDFEVKDFTDVSLDVCIQRDADRIAPVGKAVIMRMYEQYVKDNSWKKI
jgi:predicted kinase